MPAPVRRIQRISAGKKHFLGKLSIIHARHAEEPPGFPSELPIARDDNQAMEETADMTDVIYLGMAIAIVISFV
jgi:hypothetical protein